VRDRFLSEIRVAAVDIIVVIKFVPMIPVVEADVGVSVTFVL